MDKGDKRKRELGGGSVEGSSPAKKDKGGERERELGGGSVAGSSDAKERYE